MQNKLNRSLSLSIVTLYGVGTIVGAGIYALIGKITVHTGIYLPYAFLLSAFIAGFTAISYAELSSRFPQSAGAAVYLQNIWHNSVLSSITGYLVILTSIVSAATILHGFAGYLNVFIKVDFPLAIASAAVLLTFIAIIGINLSARLIAIITLIELSGLLYVMLAGLSVSPIVDIQQLLTFPSLPQSSEIIIGAFVAFYAFIGFEDMVNIIEETKHPRKNLARALILAILISTVFYLLISYVMVTRVPITELAQSSAPFSYVVQKAGYSQNTITLISLIAVMNGALVQIIVAARIFYSMGNLKLAPQLLAKINDYTKTPIHATLLVFLMVIIFALCFPILTLAKITSFIILMVFTLINYALMRLKLTTNRKANFNCPIIVPMLGCIFCGALVLYQIAIYFKHIN